MPTITYWTGVQALLLKLTASHFWVLIIENANENMPNMILIALHNENTADFNENLMANSLTAIELLYKS